MSEKTLTPPLTFTGRLIASLFSAVETAEPTAKDDSRMPLTVDEVLSGRRP